jgi:membrane protein YdbS with pleckstrin-like domain
MNDRDGPAAHEAESGEEPPDGETAGGDPTATPATDAGAAEDAVDAAEPTGPSDTAAGGDGPAAANGGVDVGASEAVGDLEPGSVDVEALTGPRRELDPRIRLVWILRTGFVALVLGGLTGAAGVLTPLPTLVGPVVFTVAFVLGVALALARYRSWSYRIREDSLFLDRGVITRVQTVVPYVRIQHVDASRGPIERLFGLATVVVYTAGSRGADVSIPGLTPERAEDLQDRLKRLAIAAEGEDAV